MRGELVALDLETTGLDPAHDDVIEIGAVRFEGSRIVDEWSTFVKPTRPIPYIVTQITGITEDDVQNAPPMQAVLPTFRAFIGDSAWVAHNASFDGAFLTRMGIAQANLRIDTFDLAPILMPRSPRYSLTSLTQLIGFNIESAHRALYDARATAYLYWTLWEKLIALPPAMLMEMATLARAFDWDVRPIFDAALREHGIQTLPERFERALFAPTAMFDPLPASEPPTPTDTPIHAFMRSEASAILGRDGALAQTMDGYQERRGQMDMAEAINDAINESFHLMIEAGTGIGKSLAYLVPAAQWAAAAQDRVVISTNTINLQEQLLNHDIPLLQNALGRPIRAAMMKGRANYLCPRRFNDVRARPSSVDDARMIAKILVWLTESKTGDRSEINLRGQDEQIAWANISAEDANGCQTTTCASRMAGVCPFHKARTAADNAHVVIVNHALLFADAVSDTHILPSYSRVVLDEAHNLEEAITSSQTVKYDENGVRRRLDNMIGLLRALAMVTSQRGSERDAQRYNTFSTEVGTALRLMQTHVGALFAAVRSVANEATRNGDYYAQIRIEPSIRALNTFSHAQQTWNTVRDFAETISGALGQGAGALRRLIAAGDSEYDGLLVRLNDAARYLSDWMAYGNGLLDKPTDNTIYWITLGQNEPDYISLHSAPQHIGSLMDQFIWSDKASAILTSATLQAGGSFEFIQERLGAHGIPTLEIASPFNYREQALVFLPTDIAEPNDKDRYQIALERAIIELATALDGRTMVLFTSYTHLRQTAGAITARLALGGIVVYDQSDGSSRQALLDGFKTSEKAVLLGTKSFWEGVDIPGETLSAIVIARLPFAPPNDPIQAARADGYSDHFNNFSLPDAVLHFRQGVGRLIRSTSDRGVLVIFDARIRTKKYGVTFLEALPDCTVKQATLNTLADTAVKWIKPTPN
jgi:DNA polymerase-3 subunit epsilon/ATP-dependent DNA helicase DinG